MYSASMKNVLAVKEGVYREMEAEKKSAAKPRPEVYELHGRPYCLD